MRRIALALVLLAACSKAESPQPTAGSGSAGSGSGYAALGKKPTNARRPTPPPGIDAKAVALGAKAPEVSVVDASGAPWTLAEAMSKHARVMLVFYRGDW